MPEGTNKYSISAEAALADIETRILKQGDSFAIFDLRGDIYHVGNDELGVYYRGTRYLSRLELRLGYRAEPLLLNSYLRDDNGLFKIELTNPDIKNGSPEHEIKKGTLYLGREKFLLDSCCFERIIIHNYTNQEVSLPLVLMFEGDFRDIFEVRGMQRERRGKVETQITSDREVDILYTGLDQIQRTARISFSFALDALKSDRAEFTLRIPPYGEAKHEISISFSESGSFEGGYSCEDGGKAVLENHLAGKRHFCEIQSNNQDFNRWVNRSRDDLVMLTTKTSTGDPYPYAGVPWYATAFGRDGIWTALLCLWANPNLSAGVLRFLAKTQASKIDREADAEPGKIVHEVREGEMAALKEIPFGSYYGSVDSTPLFLVLAEEYYQRTGDKDLIAEIWPNLELALKWIDHYGDIDGDGFVEYGTDSKKGLVQQGWKDSHDSIFHADGSDAKGPIALCEVQAYVYGAKIGMARLYRARGEKEAAEKLEKAAQKLKENFQKKFWLPELGMLALALDGDKTPCEVFSSNAGHALYFDILDKSQCDRIAQTLLSAEMFSRWGVRTISTRAARYNPMSYHNGSVWPHDNAILALGLARCGRKDAVQAIFEGMYQASTHVTHARMPELICGFPMVEANPPTLYPVACSPQAWASATVYALVRALLGIEISAVEKKISFRYATLSTSAPRIRLENLRIGNATLAIVFESVNKAVAVHMEQKHGELNVVIEK